MTWGCCAAGWCVELVTGLQEWTVRETPASSGEREQVIRFSTPWNIAFPMDAPRVEALRRICKRFGIRLAHIRHFLGNAPEVIDVLHGLEIPTVFSVHDFYTVCPTVKLIDEQGQHCGGSCTDGKGDCPGEDRYAHQFPFLKHRYVNEWRRRTSRALSRCQALLTTSAHVQELVVRAMPELSDNHWEIIEHGRDMQAYRDCCGPPDEGRPTVLFFGQLTAAKGADVVRRLCELNHDAGSPFDMQFLGTPVDDPERFPGATWHGPYQRDELPGRLASIRPSITLIPSQWPETWCHVLTEAWAAGVPVMASETGALADRLRREGGGWLVSRATDAQAWFDELQRVLLSRSSDYPMQRAIARSHVPTSPRQMAERYLSVYRLLLEPAPARGALPAGGSSDSRVGTEGGVVEEPPAMRSE